MSMRSITITIVSLLMAHFETALAANFLTLEDYLQKVEAQSPDIRIEKSVQAETTARAQGVRVSPPMVGFMTMRDSSGDNRGIELSQEIPFPTKIQKEKEVRDLEAQSQSSQFEFRKNEILQEARVSYFEFWRAFEKKKILLEKSAWLKNHVKLSRTIARTDSAAQIHLLGTESEADMLEIEILESQADLLEKVTSLKVYAPDLATEILTPKEPKLESIEVDRQSKSNYLLWKENELSSVVASQDLKKQSYIPDLILRYRSYNGNDMTARNEEIMIGFTLPFLFFWQPQSEASEASARSQRAQAELQKARLTFETRLSSLLQKTEAYKNQLSVLKDKLLPRAHKRMNLVENLSVRSMEGLDEHRAVMLEYLDLRNKEVDIRSDYEKTLSEVSKLVGKKEAGL